MAGWGMVVGNRGVGLVDNWGHTRVDKDRELIGGQEEGDSDYWKVVLVVPKWINFQIL